MLHTKHELYSAFTVAYTCKRKPSLIVVFKNTILGKSEEEEMTVATAARSTVTVTEELRANAAHVVEQVGDEKFSRVTITTVTGKSIDVPTPLAEVLDSIVHRMEQGGRVVLESMPELLTTTAAAGLLGVSRPTLVKLIDEGRLPAVMRGTHRRVRLSELMDFRHKRELERSDAISELLEADFGDE